MKTKLTPTKYHSIHIPEGFTDYEDIYIEAIEACPDGGKVVEVGAFVGKSTVMMNELIELSGKKIDFFTIDNFTMQANYIEKEDRYTFSTVHPQLYQPTFDYYQHNLEHFGYWHSTHTLIGNSADMVMKFEDETLDFVWIDAAHDYQNVLLDMNNWYRKIKPGGIMAGHDYSWGWAGFSQLRKAVHEWAMNNELRYTISGNSWIIYKPLNPKTEKLKK